MIASRAAFSTAVVAAVPSLSLVAVVGAVALLGLYLVGSNPWLVLALGLVLCGQGDYRLAGRQRPVARRAQLAQPRPPVIPPAFVDSSCPRRTSMFVAAARCARLLDCSM